MPDSDTDAVSEGTDGFVASIGRFTIALAVRKDGIGVALVLRLQSLG